MDEMKSEMEKRGFASTECNTMKIMDAMDSLGKMIASLSAGGGKKASAEEDVDDENSHFVVFDEDEAVEYVFTRRTNTFLVKKRYS
jgi:ribonuclease PH